MTTRCLDCHQLTVRGSRCPACARKYEVGRSLKRGGWGRQRENALVQARDQRRCTMSGPHDGRLVVDHIVPLADGGPDTPGNKRTVCELHHRAITAAWRAARAVTR